MYCSVFENLLAKTFGNFGNAYPRCKILFSSKFTIAMEKSTVLCTMLTCSKSYKYAFFLTVVVLYITGVHVVESVLLGGAMGVLAVSSWLLNVSATGKVYLRDGSAETIVRADTLKWKLQIELISSLSRSTLSPGRPVPSQTWQDSHQSTWSNSTGDVRVAHRLIGLVVKASVSTAAEPGSTLSISRGDFSGWSHTNDFEIDTPVAILPGASRCSL